MEETKRKKVASCSHVLTAGLALVAFQSSRTAGDASITIPGDNMALAGWWINHLAYVDEWWRVRPIPMRADIPVNRDRTVKGTGLIYGAGLLL